MSSPAARAAAVRAQLSGPLAGCPSTVASVSVAAPSLGRPGRSGRRRRRWPKAKRCVRLITVRFHYNLRVPAENFIHESKRMSPPPSPFRSATGQSSRATSGASAGPSGRVVVASSTSTCRGCLRKQQFKINSTSFWWAETRRVLVVVVVATSQISQPKQQVTICGRMVVMLNSTQMKSFRRNDFFSQIVAIN